MSNKLLLVTMGLVFIFNQLNQSVAYAQQDYSISYGQKDMSDGDIDVVSIASSHSKLDIRTKYTHEILNKALNLSSEKYGLFKLNKVAISMSNDVTFYELSRGKIINVAMSGATPDKDHLATPIRIPIRRGILNYRLLIINKKNLKLFEKINSLAQLKPYSVGIHSNSVTSDVMKVLGFSVVDTVSYDGMFKQLSQDKFDYIPRGLHEAYDEIELRKETINNLIVEPNLALYSPLPYYIYVSPAYPKLAERIEYGLEKMIEQGLIAKIFERYYGEDIKRSKLSERTIINIGNPFLSPKTPLHRKELWIDGFDIKDSQLDDKFLF